MSKSRLAALALGPILHVAADRVPHRHPRHDVWEYATGAVTLGLLVRKRGLFDAATIGAIAAVAPDLEHLLPRKPQRRKLFHNRRRQRIVGPERAVGRRPAGAERGTPGASAPSTNTGSRLTRTPSASSVCSSQLLTLLRRRRAAIELVWSTRPLTEYPTPRDRAEVLTF